MTERDVIVRCPGCGNGKVIPLALGQLLQCDVCRTKFQAPLAEDREPGLATLRDSAVVVPPEVPAGATAEHSASGQRRAASDSESGSSGSDRRARRSRSWRTEELGDVSGQETATRTRGGAAKTSLPGSDSDEKLDMHESPGWIWTVVTMLAVGIILATIVVAGFFVLRHFLPTRQDGTVAARAPREREQQNVPWTDASRAAQRIDSMTLKVEQAVYGSLRVKDLAHQVIMTEDDNLLGITISARNQGRRARHFHNWYGHAFENDSGGELVAHLNDDQGRSYALLKFDDVSYIEGQRLTDLIEPQETAQDTVVFLIPEDVDRGTIQYFRLALPGAAVDMDATFRFEIPTSMIRGFAAVPGDGQGENVAPGE